MITNMVATSRLRQGPLSRGASSAAVGGFPRWAGEGRAVSREVVRHAPVSFTAKVPW